MSIIDKQLKQTKKKCYSYTEGAISEAIKNRKFVAQIPCSSEEEKNIVLNCLADIEKKLKKKGYTLEVKPENVGDDYWNVNVKIKSL